MSYRHLLALLLWEFVVVLVFYLFKSSLQDCRKRPRSLENTRNPPVCVFRLLHVPSSVGEGLPQMTVLLRYTSAASGRSRRCWVTCWHLSYVFVYREQGGATGERQPLSGEWLSWSRHSLSGGGGSRAAAAAASHRPHMQHRPCCSTNKHQIHSHSKSTTPGQVQVFHSGLFISYYQVISGDFISK